MNIIDVVFILCVYLYNFASVMVEIEATLLYFRMHFIMWDSCHINQAIEIKNHVSLIENWVW